MASIELRTYVLKTAEAAKEFAVVLKAVTNLSLPKYKITTYGVFTSPTRPESIVSIVRYNEGTPDGMLNGYVGSEDYLRDFEAFDRSSMDRIEHEALNEVDWAKLK